MVLADPSMSEAGALERPNPKRKLGFQWGEYRAGIVRCRQNPHCEIGGSLIEWGDSLIYPSQPIRYRPLILVVCDDS